MDKTTTYQLAKSVFLIGFMGAGKSSVAQAVGSQYNLPIVDVDQLIEESAGCTIPAIFEQQGEAAFRERESACMRQVAQMPPCIVSCGGGVVEDPNNVALMRKVGFVVYLVVDYEQVQQRIPNTASRPLLADAAHVRLLLQRREPLYEQAAHITIDTRGVLLDNVIKQVVQALKRLG